MMQVSQKSRYALRALFDLALRYGEGPTRIADIAQRQAIPPRFLEGILNHLRQAGLVSSIRGARGGYMLSRAPSEISVGEMMRVTEGPLAPTGCVNDPEGEKCPLYPNCSFLPMWQRAAAALSAVYDSTTFQTLIDEERRRAEQSSPSYVI